MVLLVLLLLSSVASTAAPAGIGSAGPGGHVVAPAGSTVAPLGNDLGAIHETLALPAATWFNDRDGDKVFDSLEARFTASPLAAQPTIVTFVQGADADAAFAKVRQAAGSFPVTHAFRSYGGFAAPLTGPQATSIAALPEVRQVEWSQPGEAELDTATATFGVRAVQDGLATDDPETGIPAVTGDGIVIAIMDTGFDGAHVDLQGKFVRFIDWADDGAEKAPYDTAYHGTHVASIAGGLGVGEARYKGVAPGAAFVGFQITGGDTKANSIASIDWILAHPEVQVRITTISFGFGLTVDGTDALELAMDKAWAAGIVPFKSNGNSGPEMGTTTIPGGARGILSVGNMFDDGEGGMRLSSSSSRGPTDDGRIKPDIVAPGSLIMAASNGTNDGYQALSGTSMASPFAAGTAALMLDADPTLTPDDVRRILTTTAHEWGAGGADGEFGAGRLDALRAVQQVLVERAVRERWPYEQVAALGVAAPVTTVHAYGELTGARSEATFEVTDATQPVAVTIIANGTPQQVATPAGNSPGVRAAGVEIVDPSQTVVGTLDTAPTSRQHTFTFVAATAGTYTLRAVNLAGEESLSYDVSAGIAGVALPSIIPDEASYLALLGTEAEAADASEAPGLSVLSVLVGLGMAVAVVGRRRQ